MFHNFPGVLGKQRQSYNRPTNSVTYTTTSIAAGTPLGNYGASWTQVIASAPFDVTAIRITNTAATANSAARGDYAVTVAKGGAGVEQQIVGPLHFGGRPAYSSYTLPIFVPSGQRISMKSAAGVASRAIAFSIDIWGGPNRDQASLPTSWMAYGMTVSSGTGAYGTLHTAGSSNAFSSWTEIVASTTYSHDLWLPMAGIGTGTTITALNYRTQFAISSAADAATMVTNGTGVFNGPWFTGATTESLGAYNASTNPVISTYDDIIYSLETAGSKLSVRAMCSGTPDTNALSLAFLAAVK